MVLKCTAALEFFLLHRRRQLGTGLVEICGELRGRGEVGSELDQLVHALGEVSHGDIVSLPGGIFGSKLGLQDEQFNFFATGGSHVWQRQLVARLGDLCQRGLQLGAFDKVLVGKAGDQLLLGGAHRLRELRVIHTVVRIAQFACQQTRHAAQGDTLDRDQRFVHDAILLPAAHRTDSRLHAKNRFHASEVARAADSHTHDALHFDRRTLEQHTTPEALDGATGGRVTQPQQAVELLTHIAANEDLGGAHLPGLVADGKQLGEAHHQRIEGLAGGTEAGVLVKAVFVADSKRITLLSDANRLHHAGVLQLQQGLLRVHAVCTLVDVWLHTAHKVRFGSFQRHEELLQGSRELLGDGVFLQLAHKGTARTRGHLGRSRGRGRRE